MLMQEYDLDFLKELYNSTIRTTYVKIISYNLHDEPIECIEGEATGGSINIDGQSSARRTCNISLVANLEDVKLHDYNWGLSTCFELFVGLYNFTNRYRNEKIIWFNVGKYLISSFSYSMDMTKYTITINGKDKIAKLNGELGGTFTALQTDLSKVDEIQDDGSIKTTKLSIYEILLYLVHSLGGEPLHNIIIKDLPTNGQELLEYRGSSPLYIYKDKNGSYVDYKTDPNTQVALINDPDTIIKISSDDIVCERVGQPLQENLIPSKLYPVINGEVQVDDDNYYTLLKVLYGEAAGYHPTELIYPSDLIMNLGETIVNALDKIKNMLVNFEYFYNEQGQFVFQQKPSTIVASVGITKDNAGNLQYSGVQGLINNELWEIDDTQNNLTTKISATTPINQIKNDFSLWGRSGNKNIHLRYSIKQKPKYYKKYDNTEYITKDYAIQLSKYQIKSAAELNTLENMVDNDLAYNIITNQFYKYTNASGWQLEGVQKVIYDWRELIYQMALDYNKNGTENDFRSKIYTNNKNNMPMPTGGTGYENYYIDMLAFWRELYDPDPEPKYEQIPYNTPLNVLPLSSRYVDEFEGVSKMDSKLTTAERKDLYVIRNATDLGTNANQLISWIDAVNLNEIKINTINNKLIYSASTTVAERAQLYNALYYTKGSEYHKIINSLDFSKNLIYVTVKNGGASEQKFIIDALTEELQEKIYISSGKNGPLVKYLDGISVVNFVAQSDDLETYSDSFWLKSNTYTAGEIYEIYYDFLDGRRALIWQKSKNEPIRKTDIEIIAEAITNHRAHLKCSVRGSVDLIALEANDIISVRAKHKTDSVYLWIKEDDEKATPKELWSEVLSYDYYNLTDKTNKFDIYNTYFKTTATTLTSVLELVDVNKANLYYLTKDSTNTDIFVLLMDALPLLCFAADKDSKYYIKTTNKIKLDNIDENLEQFYYVNASVQDSIVEYFNTNRINLLGKIHQAHADKTINTKIKYYKQYYDYLLGDATNKNYTECWNTMIYENFTKATFWIDFLDGDSQLIKNSVDNIGCRQKTLNDQTCTSLDFGTIPNIQFLTPNEIVDTGYQGVVIETGLMELFSISAQGKSCSDLLSETLTTMAVLQSDITITTIPIYHLQPNTILTINNQATNTFGKYEIAKITMPLTYNGTMTINAKKILETL